MRPTLVRLLAPLCLLLLPAASCRDGYQEVSGGYYYNGPAGDAYLELGDMLYKRCDLYIDGKQPSLWGNRRAKVSPGTREVRCRPKMGALMQAASTTVEFRAGKVLHLDNIW